MACKSCNPGPLFLRLSMGAIFIIAGLGKVTQTAPVKGEDAAWLANMGYASPAAPAAAPATPAAPAGGTPTDAKPQPTAPGGGSGSGSSAAPNPEPKSHSTRPVPTEPLPAGKGGHGGPPALMRTTMSGGGKTYTAADFADPVQVKMVYTLAVMLKNDAAGVDAEGKPTMRLVPDWAGKGNWPVYLAWCCAITELVGGAFVLIGFLTRLSAFGLAFNMAMAMWLTQFGPAMQSGHTQLGFLPDHPLFSQDWQMLMFQGSLFSMALALLCLGCGALGLDNLLFPGPLPPKPKPAPEAKPVQ